MMLVTLMLLSSFSTSNVANAEVDVADPLLYAVPATEHSGDDLTDEVLAALGMGNRQLVQKRIGSFESIIHPMFLATPKNEFGRLGHAASRYILHRFFVNRHGWFVHGLFAGQGGIGWNSTSIGEVVKNHSTAYVQNAFDRQLGKTGLELRGLALLAAIIEVSVYDAAEQDLRACYKTHRVHSTDTIDVEKVDRILAVHIARRVLEANHPKALQKFFKTSPRGMRNEYSIEDIEPFVLEIMPQWPLTKEFLVGLRMELQPGRSDFSYEIVAGLTREIEGRWARWAAAQDCNAMKSQLSKIEEGTSGCVRLADFYNYSFNSPSGWGFKESPRYLSQLGVLDESKQVPRVIISNYLQSQSNCIPMTKHYMACCVNECEGLQMQIESKVQKPDAKPEDVLRIINHLPSPSSDSQRQLPKSVKRHLDEIAALHEGVIPLQSRLFSEWMHFAYPHECPFPYLAGSKRPEEPHPERASIFVKKNLALHIIEEGSHFARMRSNGTCMPWSEEEEMFVPTVIPSTTTLAQLEQDSAVWASIYLVAVCSASALLVAVVLKGLKGKQNLSDFRPSFLV